MRNSVATETIFTLFSHKFVPSLNAPHTFLYFFCCCSFKLPFAIQAPTQRFCINHAHSEFLTNHTKAVGDQQQQISEGSTLFGSRRIFSKGSKPFMQTSFYKRSLMLLSCWGASLWIHSRGDSRYIRGVWNVKIIWNVKILILVLQAFIHVLMNSSFQGNSGWVKRQLEKC